MFRRDRRIDGRSQVADRSDLHLAPERVVLQRKQLVLVHRRVGREVVHVGRRQQPIVDSYFLDDALAELRELERGYTVPAMMGEPLQLISILVGEEPLEQ